MENHTAWQRDHIIAELMIPNINNRTLLFADFLMMHMTAGRMEIRQQICNIYIG